MWPFISQPAPSSLILFPTQRSQRRRRGEKGAGLIVSFILRTHKHYLFKRFSWLLMTSFVLQQESFDGFCKVYVFVPAAAVCLIWGLFLGRWRSLWLTWHCLLSDWILSIQACSPSAALIQMCQIRLRGKPPGFLLICAIMEFHANKLSWLTVTIQWFGSISVTWQRRASSLSEAIMRKWSFAIELCNDKYWLISVLIG